jgi:Ca2+-binding EF-hand superfamily protein
LIQTDPKKRFSSDKALKHKWLKGETASDKALGDEVLSNIANYTRASKLKKLLVRMLARDMDNEDEKELHSQFALMDDDGDGYIDLKELTKFIKNTGVSHAEAYRRASSIMDDIDQDGDGKISVDEFKDSRISTQLQNDEVIRKQFNQIDVDGDGHITQEELAELFNWTLADQMIIEMIKEIDENGDGVISLEEFEAAMKKGAMAQALQPKQQSKEESMKQLSSKIKKMQNMNI